MLLVPDKAVRLGTEKSIPCRHVFDRGMVARLRSVLRELPEHSGTALRRHNIDLDQYDVLFRAAIESIRGTYAATGKTKRRFIEAVLGHMQAVGAVAGWDFIGSEKRQDYKVHLPSGRVVGIEAKGGPDGNNMNIWELPAWADEFVIWSQSPDSLEHDPGHGVWSGLATRIIPNILATGKKVDAMIFYDGRCGSAIRRCPKGQGVEDELRAKATDIVGQDGRSWLPPPCVYLLPRTVPHPYNNPSPPLHGLDSCQFARAMLGAFGVPDVQQRGAVHWAKASFRPDERGIYLRVSVGTGLDNDTPTVQGRWKSYRRE